MMASNVLHSKGQAHLLLSRAIEDLKLQGISEAYLNDIVFPESLISCDSNPLEQMTKVLTPEDPLFRPLHNLIQTIETSLLPTVSDPNPVHDIIHIYRRFILEQCFEITGVDYQDELGQSLLQFATKEGDEQKVENLLKKGANPCVINKNRETLLHIAAAHGHLSILQTLLQCEDLNQMIDRVDGRGQTALHRAVQGNHDEIVEVLMKEEADFEICDLNGKTPLQLAQEMGNTRIVALLSQEDLVPSLTGDVEGQYYLEFERAYEEFDVEKQISYLEKMAAYALQKDNFINAARLLNGAITLLLKKNLAHSIWSEN